MRFLLVVAVVLSIVFYFGEGELAVGGKVDGDLLAVGLEGCHSALLQFGVVI